MNALFERNGISKINDLYVKDFKGQDALFVEHTTPLGLNILAVFYSECRDYDEAMEYAKDHEITHHECS